MIELKAEKDEIEDSKKITKKMKARLVEIEEEMKPLNQFLEEAKFHRAQIKMEIGMLTSSCTPFFLSQSDFNRLDSLKTDAKKVVIVLDFTKFGQIDEGNVHCFVVSLLSQGNSNSGTWNVVLCVGYLRNYHC